MTYTATKHILTASAYQASILLQFNESDSLTYEDLQAGNEMDDDNLKANLDLLLKQKILLKEDETTYELNRNFRNPKVILVAMPTK